MAKPKAPWAKKAKKRGVKPGTKRGKYKRSRMAHTMKGETITLEQMDAAMNFPFTPAQPLTLCGQLEDAILLLENRISNSIAKINSLM